MAKEVKAKYDYNSGHEDDLSFTAGQMITILEEVDDEWYNGEYHDAQGQRHHGMFPRNFVVLAPSQTMIYSPASAVKQGTAKDPVFKTKIPESAGPFAKQAAVAANSTSAKPVTSPPSSTVSSKGVSGLPIREPLAPHQPVCYMSSSLTNIKDVAKQSTPPQTQSEKPSSFRDRIAAFNKATDAPLAPRALPKPTSFVRKPFIPPPPSKESYFVPPKPIPSSKPSHFASTGHREVIEEPGKPTEEEPAIESEISKETMKERILAIQKGLVYTTNPLAPVAPPARRTDDQELDETQSPSLEHGMEPSIREETEAHEEPSAKFGSDHVEENQDILDVNSPQKTAEPEDLGETSKSQNVIELDATEVDPEVARRIAIRERMAKMSGGMGMHMAMGMRPPPAFSKSPAAPKPPSSPPTSPPSERRDPIPIIPGLPALKPQQPEIQNQAMSLDETSAGTPSSSDKPPLSYQATKPTTEKEKTVSSVLEAESDDDDLQNSSDEAEAFHSEQGNFGMHQDEPSEEESSGDDYPKSPRPPITEDSRRSNSTSVSPMSSDKRLHSLQTGGETPPLISSRPAPIDTSPRASRPPPPPPPIPSVFHASPLPVPLPPRSEQLLAQVSSSEEPAYNDSDGEESSMASEEVKNDGYGSPKSPLSRPPPPPPPAPSIPPRSPPTSSLRAPPIPPTPRNFESEHHFDEKPPTLPSLPSLPSLPAPYPAPVEQYRSTDIYVDNPRYHSPSSPTSAPFRRTQSERPSLDSSRGRSSMEPHRQEGSYISMKEENIQDGRQWWLDPVSPPFAFRNRKDLTYEVEDSTSTRRGGHTSVTREVYIIFSDYSQTIITAQYDRDEPSRVTLNQRHLPPPTPPSKAELESRHEQIGHQVVALAQARLGASVGNGSSLAFVQEIFSKLENCLPSAGARSHGALVYSNFGNSSTRQFDEIRPGDVVAFRNATFQGHGGLRGKVITEVGKPDHVAVIHEWNGSKKKLKVLEQRQETRRVAHNSYKIGDLKSGEVHIFRPMPRSWVDW